MTGNTKLAMDVDCGPIEYNNIEYNTEKLKKFFDRDSSFWTEFKAEFRSEKKDFDEEEDRNYEANLKALSKILGKKNTQKIVERSKPYKIGRLYPEAKQSCVTLPRVIANYLVGDKLDDCDVVNCHPCIFDQLIKHYVSTGKLSYGCPELEEYVSDRKAALEKYGFTKGDFMPVMYDSNFIRNKNGTSLVNKLTAGINKFLMNEFYKLVSEEYAEELKVFVTQRKARMRRLGKPANHNLEGACLSIIAQTYERTISVQVERFLKKNYDVPRCMVYDGFYICKSIKANEGGTKILEEIESHVKNTTGFNVKLVFKEVKNEAFELFMDRHEKLVKGEYLEWKQKWEVNHFYTTKNKGEIICDYYEDKHIYPDVKTLIDKYVYNPDFMDMFKDGGSMFKLWMEDKDKRNYRDFDFYPPPGVCPPGVYNTWKGYERSDGFIEYTNEEGDLVWGKFGRYITHLASGDQAVKIYIMRYMAHLIRTPGLKAGVGFLQRGRQGTGKGTIGELIMALIGKRYFLLTTETDEILGRFTSSLENKIVVVLDEISPTDMNKKTGALKSIITNPTHAIEYKGVTRRHERSCVNIIMNTNSENSIKIESGDRRMVVIEPDVMTTEQAEDIQSLIKNDRMVQILFQKLSEEDYIYEDMKEWQDNRPFTNAYLEMQSHSLDNRCAFLYKYLGEKKEKQAVLEGITNEDIYRDYILWCTNNNKMPFEMEGLAKKISKIKGVTPSRPVKKDGKTSRVRDIDIEVALEHMKESKMVYLDESCSMFEDSGSERD